MKKLCIRDGIWEELDGGRKDGNDRDGVNYVFMYEILQKSGGSKWSNY